MSYLQITWPDGHETRLELNRKEPVLIGQHSTNTIVIDQEEHPLLSARLLWNKRAKRYEITAASSDDLKVGGEPVRSKMLKDQDTIELADHVIVFHKSSESDSGVKDSESKPEERNKEESSSPSENDSEQSRELSANSSPEVKSGLGSLELTSPQVAADEESIKDWVTRSRRPGERTASRSPLITTLTIVALLLFVAAGGVYLLIGRQTAQRAYDAARADRDAGKHAQAVSKYEEFLSQYGAHSLAPTARVERDLSNIDRELNGAGADPATSLDAIDQFIEIHRSEENFRDWYPLLATYAKRVAMTCYRGASRQHSPDLVKLGDRARETFSRFMAADGSDEAEEREIEGARRKALSDLLEFDVAEKTFAQCDAALKNKNVTEALTALRTAIVRYPQFEKRKDFLTRIKSALSMEQGFVNELTPDQIPVAASKTDEQRHSEQRVRLANVQTARGGLVSSGEIVWLLADGELLGVERQTGQVQWTQNLGLPIPFEPQELDLKESCWLVPIASGRGIRAIGRKSGDVKWEQTFKESITTDPTVVGNLVFVVLSNHMVVGLQAYSGEIVGGSQFPQPISAPLASLDNHQMICIGLQDIFYILDRQTWECTDVRFLGHSPGAIKAKPLPLADQVLFVNNDRLNSGAMELVPQVKTEEGFEKKILERLPGLGLGSPLLWGDRLFLEMNGPRIAAWQLSADPSEKLLNRITNASIPFSSDIELRVHPIEGDRLLVAGQNVRELVLLSSSFEQIKQQIDLGHSPQSIQVRGAEAFIAGEEDPVKGISFYHYNHQDNDSAWRLSVSSDPLSLWSSGAMPPAIFCVDSNGKLFRSLDENFTAGKVISALETLFSTTSKSKVSESQVYVARSESEQHVFVSQNAVRQVSVNGQVTSSGTLPAKCTLPPALVGQRMLFGSDLAVHLVNTSNWKSTLVPWQIPTAEPGEAAWKVKKVAAVANDQFLVQINDSRILSLVIRSEPQPHLALSGEYVFDSPLIGEIQVLGTMIWAVTNANEIIQIDGVSLTQTQKGSLPDWEDSRLFLSDDLILVDSQAGGLVAYQQEDLSQLAWQVEENLTRVLTVATHLSSDNERVLFLGFNDGTIETRSSTDGKLLVRHQLNAAPSCTPIAEGEQLIIGTTAGTLDRIPLSSMFTPSAGGQK